MKKVLTLTLVLVLILSLAACGGSGGSASNPPTNGSSTTPGTDAGNSTPGTSQNGNNTSAPNNNSGDTDTVAGYLAQFGLTEDDIKPNGFDSFEGPDGWLIKVNAGEGEANTWGKQIYDKIKSISDDGKVYDQGYPTFKDEASWSDNGTIYQWSYVYNGKTVEVDVTPPVDTPTQYRIALHFQ